MYLLFPIASEPPLISIDTDYVTAGVSDGVKCGHTCCTIHDCTIPLSDQQDRFCPTHEDQQFICCIQGCQNPVEAGYRSCTEPSHRNIETSRRPNGSAVRLLRDRLHRAGVENVSLAGGGWESAGDASAGVEASTSPDITDTSSGSKPQGPRGRISRRWTHNEQLFVFCCGIIASCATFFGSEGVSGVKVSLKYTRKL